MCAVEEARCRSLESKPKTLQRDGSGFQRLLSKTGNHTNTFKHEEIQIHATSRNSQIHKIHLQNSYKKKQIQVKTHIHHHTPMHHFEQSQYKNAHLRQNIPVTTAYPYILQNTETYRQNTYHSYMVHLLLYVFECNFLQSQYT